MSALNDLTKEMYAQGYTRLSYPDHVYCGDWQNFSYKFEYLKTMVWEAPCGLLSNEIAIGELWNEGIEHCAENNNPLFGCPCHGKRNGSECKYYKKGFPKGITCEFHISKEQYSYDKSIEKLWDERDFNLQRKISDLGKGYYCHLFQSINDETLEFTGKYDVDKCITYTCENDFCPIRNKPRDLTKVNVFYDIKRTWHTKQGFLENMRSEIEKGVRAFPKAISKTDAEIWMRIKEAERRFKPFKPKLDRTDRRDSYFSKIHRLDIEGYEHFEFNYETMNFRIARAAGRDLEQDMADIAEGIKIYHASDKIKAAKEAKSERRKKYQESKKNKRKSKSNGIQIEFSEMK